MSNTQAKVESRGFYGSAAVFGAIIIILGVLFFIEVPESNNDIVKVIIGMLVASLSMIMYTIAGRNPDEVEKLQTENVRLVQENTDLRERLDKLETMFMDFQKSELMHHKEMIEKFETVFTKLLQDKDLS